MDIRFTPRIASTLRIVEWKSTPPRDASASLQYHSSIRLVDPQGSRIYVAAYRKKIAESDNWIDYFTVHANGDLLGRFNSQELIATLEKLSSGYDAPVSKSA